MVDDLVLDTDNAEFNYASEFVMQTNRLVYLTGKAGTGKTTFLKHLKNTCKKSMVVLAPTGVAAVNAGGQTIHSFLNIKPSVYVPGDKRLRVKAPSRDEDKTVISDHFRYQREKLELIRNMELLVIDEISMVRCDLLDVIDRLLRYIRKREFTPFGGVQVILIGDTFQLPPIANYDDWSVLSRFYSSPYFFSARVLDEVKPVYIELKKIYRQTDDQFIQLLNRIRLNRLAAEDIKLLNSRYLHGFDPEKSEDYIILASHNRMVEATNQRRLDEIDSELFCFEADIEGTFPENGLPADRLLQLKEGAQVMMLRNDRNKKYFNGKIGHIVEVSDSRIKVQFPDESMVDVAREQWDNIRYKWDPKDKKVVEESIGTFVQFPVKLAWAITVHKSQGLTFDKVIADVAESFTHGQVYVALSRCTTFEGLLLRTPISTRAIKTDPVVLEFAAHETPGTMLMDELKKSKSCYYLKVALEYWLSNDYVKATESFMVALDRHKDDHERIFKFCDYALFRHSRKSEVVLEYSRELLNEAADEPARDKSAKKVLQENDTLLKAQIAHTQTLASLIMDLEELEEAEDIIARYGNLLDRLIADMTCNRKAIKEVKKKIK